MDAVTRRLLVVFGTRPEAIKLFPVIAALRAELSLDVRVLVTAQHRDMLDQVLSLARIVARYRSRSDESRGKASTA